MKKTIQPLSHHGSSLRLHTKDGLFTPKSIFEQPTSCDYTAFIYEYESTFARLFSKQIFEGYAPAAAKATGISNIIEKYQCFAAITLGYELQRILGQDGNAIPPCWRNYQFEDVTFAAAYAVRNRTRDFHIVFFQCDNLYKIKGQIKLHNQNNWYEDNGWNLVARLYPAVLIAQGC